MKFIFGKRGAAPLLPLLLVGAVAVVTLVSTLLSTNRPKQTTSTDAKGRNQASAVYNCYSYDYNQKNCNGSYSKANIGTSQVDQSRSCYNTNNNTHSQKVVCEPVAEPTATTKPKICTQGPGCRGGSPGDGCNDIFGNDGRCTQQSINSTGVGCICKVEPTSSPTPTLTTVVCAPGTERCAGANPGRTSCSKDGVDGTCIKKGDTSGQCFCNIPTPTSLPQSKYCQYDSNGNSQGVSSCGEYPHCSTGLSGKCLKKSCEDQCPAKYPGNATSTPIPIIAVTDSPTPTPPPRGSCKAAGSSCDINDPNACGAGCESLGCAYGPNGESPTCITDNGQGGCPQDVCRNNACAVRYVNPGPAGCPGDRCADTTDCNQPPPNPGSCTVSGPSVVTFVEDGLYNRNKALAEMTMTKSEYGAKVICTQPTILTNGSGADCSEYALDKFTPCDDPQSCTGTIQAKNRGTCKVTFNCTNVQSNEQFSCSKNVTIDTALPSPSPTSKPGPTGTKQKCTLKSKGDANCDDKVNKQDFVIWLSEYQNKQSTSMADFNSDGKITLVDYEIWRRHTL